jgi:hypothetical protein
MRKSLLSLVADASALPLVRVCVMLLSVVFFVAVLVPECILWIYQSCMYLDRRLKVRTSELEVVDPFGQYAARSNRCINNRCYKSYTCFFIRPYTTK